MKTSIVDMFSEIGNISVETGNAGQQEATFGVRERRLNHELHVFDRAVDDKRSVSAWRQKFPRIKRVETRSGRVQRQLDPCL